MEQFIYAKKPPQLKIPINHAPLENGTYEQIVLHHGRELEMKVLQASNELHKNNVTHHTINVNLKNLNQHSITAKNLATNYINAVSSGERKTKLKEPKKVLAEKTVVKQFLSRTDINANDSSSNNTHNRSDRKTRTVHPPRGTCGKTIHSTEKCCFGVNSANRPPH